MVTGILVVTHLQFQLDRFSRKILLHNFCQSIRSDVIGKTKPFTAKSGLKKIPPYINAELENQLNFKINLKNVNSRKYCS